MTTAEATSLAASGDESANPSTEETPIRTSSVRDSISINDDETAVSHATGKGTGNDMTNNGGDTIVELDDPAQILEDLWKGDDVEESYRKTLLFLHKEMDDILRQGMDAFRHSETVTRQLETVQDELESKESELKRLRVSEEKHRNSISNLLRALEISRKDTRDQARSTEVEATLRSELATLVASRNQASAQAEASQRHNQLLQEENRQQKTKLVQVTQAKMQLERDQRAAMSLQQNTSSVDSNGVSCTMSNNPNSQTSTAPDVTYYKRKVSELTGQLHGKNAVLAEKDRQLEDLRRQVERGMSQNRLAQFRRETTTTSGKKRSKLG